MKLITIALAVCILGVSALFGQPPSRGNTSGKVKELPSWGSVSDRKFVSTRLGITLSLPASYHVLSSAETEVLSDAGSDLLKEGVVSEKRFDEAVARTIKLLAVAEKPIGSLENSALEMVGAKQQKGVTANMSLAANLAVMKGSAFKLKRSLSPLRLGVNTFAAAELEGTIGSVNLTQRTYVIMHKGYSILFAIVYFNEKQIKEMEGVLSTLTLK